MTAPVRPTLDALRRRAGTLLIAAAVVCGAASCGQNPPAVTAQGPQETGTTGTTATSGTAPGTTARNRGTTAGTTPGTTRRRAGTSTTSTPPTGDEPIALAALITDADLPAGEWESNGKPRASAGSTDYEDLASIPECSGIGGDDGSYLKATVTLGSMGWEREPDDELDLRNRVEIYPAGPVADGIGKLLSSPDLPACLRAGMQATGLGAVEIRSFDPGVSAAEIGADYVTGFDFVMGSPTEGDGQVSNSRYVFVGIGRGMTSIEVSVMGDPAKLPDPRTVDTRDTVRAAAQKLKAALG